MDQGFERREFLKGSMATAAGIAALGHEEKILATHLAQAAPQSAPQAAPTAPAAEKKPAGTLPTGKIKDVELSRIICGGNLIGGWAHSRDLIYASKLFKAYNTEEKILETLELCEQHGVNTILTNPVSRDVINRYWRERGGKIQWISEVHSVPENVEEGVRAAIDNGASMVYIQGAVGDNLLKKNHLDTIAKTVQFIQEQGVPGGVGCHSLEVVKACEEGGVNPDFYVKTLHSKTYWSAQRPDQTADVVSNRDDNYWCIDPDKTIEYMSGVKKPWIAFKVLAAGAIHPNEGFKYAFEKGADFLCVGMFDFQIAEDAEITRNVLANVTRQRAWMA